MNSLIIFSRRATAAAVIIGLAAPLVVAPWLAFPFVSGKAFLIELAALFGLPFWTALFLLDPAARPRKHPLTLALALQAAVLALAGILGVDPAQSFWGRDERMMGVFTLLSLLALFGMALSVFRTQRAWKNILLGIVGIAWVNILWGLLEHFHPVFWSEFRGGSMRVVGLFGNPIFYAGYILGIVFLAAALLAYMRSRYAKAALWVTLFAGSVDVLYSGTRGAGLGLLGGLAIALVIFVFLSRRRAERFLAATGVAGIVALLAFFSVFRDASFLKPFSVFQRLGSAFSLTDPTVVQRLRLWQVSFEGIRSRPLLGWGPENFDYLFDQHFDPLFLKFTLRETFADRPHNAFIEAATDAGVFGFLALLAVQAAFVLSVMRLRRAGGPLWTCSALIGFLAASDVFLLFAFETAPTLLLAFFISGWLVVRTGGTGRPSGRVYPRQAVFILPVVGALSLALIVAAVIRPAAVFAAIHRATVTDPRTQTEKWLGHLRTAASVVQPYRDAARYRVANAVFSAVGDGLVPDARADEALELGLESLRQAVLRRPGDYGSRFTLGNLLLLSAARGKTERFAEAEAEFLRAADLSPRRQSTYTQLGNLKVVAGEPVSALFYYQKAVDLDPEIGEPHWHLGWGLLKAREEERAADEFVRAWNLGFRPKLKNEIREAASLLFELGDLEYTVRLYQQATGLFPDDAGLWAEAAAVYAAAGDVEGARTAVQNAVELDPSLADEAGEFLRQLEAGVLSNPSVGE